MPASAASAPALFLGLKLYELLTLAGVLAGPVTAVAITLWAEHLRRTREARTQILRMLLNTRGMPSDPAYSVAINMVPVEFNGHRKVVTAWREYIEAVRYSPTPENAHTHMQAVNAKQTTLIYQIMRTLKIGLSETDVQTQTYVADGFVRRDSLYLDSLAATREIAEATKRSADAAETLVNNLKPPKTR